MIELKNLTRRFGNLTAVDNVTLSIPRGQICGYLGPNGAGKTTTVKMLTGMLQPTAGTALIAGYDIQKEDIEVKRRIGYVPESGALYQSLTPYEYLQFVGRLYGMDDQAITKRINEFSEFFNMKDTIHQRMNEFSKGMKQKVVIASAMIHNPQVIFMDEPLNGLDANTALLLKKLLKNLANEGKTIFYCSHILDVVENLCDRVVIIDKGKIVADGSVEKLKEMTKRSSLEGVFSQLTNTEDLGELAKAFSRSITGV
ncbi:MAG: ABC transporter ATP-binding protein [Candidatus Neomarinimicrobiota bacterium]|nr:MAG: ABC transporter ATP-binding protein [Candidatus Neomarinimicrobiota bacterium]